ncbi:MFS transporter [Herbiconiux sp. CPCC 205763]|uniref:MFS transporter n=1 Tax=Herbiconiux aconitum TaxID=2970913 RepID=A0ABT2GK05_9MICO|nr:MFS transporter [Herbiconiux aconitum]MCS5716546.1 MFS transporter [Herbiconiux aconitum]
MTATSTPAPTKIGAPGAPTRSRRRWLALSVLALAQFLVVLDASIVNIALPSLGGQLALDTAALSWVITAYVLPFGGLLLLGGRLADRYGHRRLFLIGSAGFVGASALAGFAVSGEMLFMARALQGASAALLAPASLALVTHLFPLARDRAKALGIWGAVAGIGSAAGVLLGGVLTAAFGWQAVFFVNVPIGLAVLLFVPRLVTRDPESGGGRLDYPGAATITGGLVALVAALTSFEQLGLAHPLTLALVGSALALIVGFVLIERRSPAPLVSFSIFANRSVTAGNVAILLMGAAMTALFFAFSVYTQAVLHYDALTAGLSQLPLAGALVVVAGVAPAVIGRIGTRATLVGSLFVVAGGLVWLAAAPASAVFLVDLLGPTVLLGIGLGGAFVSATQLAVHGVRPSDAGLAGGLVNTSQQIGSAVGLALLSTLAATRTESLVHAGVAEAEALTAGFSWVFLGAALLAVTAGAAVLLIRDARSARAARTTVEG